MVATLTVYDPLTNSSMDAASRYLANQPELVGPPTVEAQRRRVQQHIASHRSGQFTTRAADAHADVVLIGDSDSDVECIDELHIPDSPGVVPASRVFPHSALDVSGDGNDRWHGGGHPANNVTGPAVDLLYEPTLADLDQVTDQTFLEILHIFMF